MSKLKEFIKECRRVWTVTKHLSKDKKKDYVLKRYAMSLGIREEGLTKLIENSSSKTIQDQTVF